MKVRVYDGYPAHYVGFKCPGCKNHHVLPTSLEGQDSKWGFNGDFASPTFSPSILQREFDGDSVIAVCHSFVRNGEIQFLGDCTHALAGQTVVLDEIKE